MPFYTLYKQPSALLNSGSILPKNSMRVACLLFSSLLLPLVKTENLLLETQDDVKLAVAPTTKANEMDQNGVKGSKWIKRDQNGVKGSNGKVGVDYSSWGRSKNTVRNKRRTKWSKWEVFGQKIKLTSSLLLSLL